jgi:hypothetical protein
VDLVKDSPMMFKIDRRTYSTKSSATVDRAGADPRRGSRTEGPPCTSALHEDRTP